MYQPIKHCFTKKKRVMKPLFSPLKNGGFPPSESASISTDCGFISCFDSKWKGTSKVRMTSVNVPLNHSTRASELAGAFLPPTNIIHLRNRNR